MRRRLADGSTPKRLRDFSGYETIIAFVVGWSPELDRGRSRWRSWRSYLADWESVRGEYFQLHPDRCDPMRHPYAERVRNYVARHGLADLSHPHIDVFAIIKHAPSEGGSDAA